MLFPRLDRRRETLLAALGLALAVGIWCIATYSQWIHPMFLPTPTRLIDGLLDYHDRGWLIRAAIFSIRRVVLSVALITVIGVPIGVLMGAIPVIDAMIRPLVDGVKSVPATGFIPVIVLWFSVEEKAKIVFLFLGGIFYMILMTREATLATPEAYLRVAVDIGASRWQQLTTVLFPSALPGIWAAVAVTSGLCWTYILVAEFINSSEAQLGLGYLLYMGSRTQDPGKVFGVLFVIAVISSATDWLLRSARARWAGW